MKSLFILICLFVYSFICLFVYSPHSAFAEDPLSHPNNKVGIHILFPAELSDAAKLVNSNGGDWGYVTIPIQAGDKDMKKWQDFMDQARALHVIPIIRLATEGDYFNTTSWRKPNLSDVLDFANFLNSLNWPTKNRYIIVYNEVNRADEWGGQADPAAYADMLSYAVTAFKTANPDFFIISAGLDNAAANGNGTYNEYTYLQQMNAAIPGIFNQIDGIASHSYPNPGFSEPPSVHTSESITSFLYEKQLIQSMSDKNLPTFITETGWTANSIPQTTIASYYQQAFSSVWNDGQVVAVTPFLFRAGGAGPFTQFSFLDASGNPNAIYNAVAGLPKVKGQPTLTPLVLSAATNNKSLPIENFSKDNPDVVFTISIGAKKMLKWFLHL